MTGTSTHLIEALEGKLASGAAFDGTDVDRVFRCPDLVSVGMIGEAARRAFRGDTVTFCRVAIVAGAPGDSQGDEACADAGEVRIAGAGESVAGLVARVRELRARMGKVPLTGYSLAELLGLAGGDHLRLAEIARELHAAGLESVAEAPLDELGDATSLTEIVRAVMHGGLGVWRATVTRAEVKDRPSLLETAAEVQAATGAFKALAPLPRVDPREAPATGYDDVRTIVAARLRCRAIPAIQVDWSLYGPKLAQVAIAYGADDIDGVSPVDEVALGHRRSSREDLERQIRAAFAQPVERNGRHEPRA